MNKKILLFSLLAIPTLFLQCKQQEDLPKPNILWVTIEDTSPQFIGCYGDENASTPIINNPDYRE